MLKKAMIMAAGVGSRLEALSNALPKPLVPLANEPAMDILIKHLSRFSIQDIIANTYYKSEVLENHYKHCDLGVNINFIKETELSGTAGGLKKCQFFFDEGQDFIVMSGDGLSDIDIKSAYESHKNSGSIATIVLKNISKENVSMYGIVVPDKNGYVESFQEKPSINEARSTLANTGIYIFNYSIFKYIPENTFFDFAKNVFPALMSAKEKINTYIMDGYWSDIGSISQYKQSNADLLQGKVKSFQSSFMQISDGICCIDKGTIIDSSAKIIGACVIGKNCKIGKDVKIINSVLWNDIEVLDGSIIENSIVLNDIKINDSVKDEVIAFDRIKTNVAV